MGCLPPFRVGNQSICLPLWPTTVAALADVMVQKDPAMRRPNLKRALEADPALAVWAFAHFVASGEAKCEGAQTLADWLEPRLEETFCAVPVASSCDGAPQHDEPSQVELQLSAGICRIVAAVLEATSKTPGPSRDTAILAALVRNVEQWLAHCRRPAASHLFEVAEDLLLEAVCQLANQQLPLVSEVISNAMKSLEPPHHSSSKRKSLPCESVHLAISGDFLYTLAKTLVRLRRLENDFDRELEHRKLEALAEFAYGAGHEINNPLANIAARAQTLLENERDPERKRTLAAINSQAFRAHEMIADMMLVARPPRLERAVADLNEIVREILHSIQPLAEPRGISLSNSLTSRELPVHVDAIQIRVALLAILQNSLNALSGGGQIRVESRAMVSKDARIAILEFHDNGPGIPAGVLPHIFDPFFSGREAGRGMGFGLTKCWRIVTLHGGQVSVASTAGAGTSFTLELPLHEKNVVNHQ